MKTCLRLVFLASIAVIFLAVFLVPSIAQVGTRAFSHYTRAHREGKFADCKSCHLVPTRNWVEPRRDKQDTFPDVTNFPFNVNATDKGTHTACFGCHTKDIYANGGAFCAGCHTIAGPRARALRAFPVSAHPTQFTTIFPHDVHQDAIAYDNRRNDVAPGHFILASFSAPPDDKKPEFYNCAVCHQTAKVKPKYKDREVMSDQKAPVAGTDKFVPTADFFKNMPRNHASCFNCHYQRTEPVSTNCSGCHKLADKPYFESTDVGRYSLKFSHEQVKKDKPDEKAHNQDCVACHTEIPRSSDLQTLKKQVDPDVPYVTCATCHEADLTKELEERQKNNAFQCIYCHTPAVGRYKTPISHHN